jgi:hypothetical protein
VEMLRSRVFAGQEAGDGIKSAECESGKSGRS